MAVVLVVDDEPLQAGILKTILEKGGYETHTASSGPEALALVDRDDARAARIAIADLPEPETSLRLSALRRENDALRGALGALAPLIEPAGEVAELAAMHKVRADVYAHLKADATRRTVPVLGGG